jgi:hypothetical protein
MLLSCPIELRTGLQGGQAVLLARLVDEELCRILGDVGQAAL